MQRIEDAQAEMLRNNSREEAYAEADDAGKANIIKQLYPKARDQKKIKQVFDQYLSQPGVAEGSLNEFAPDEDWRKNNRCTVPHDGIIDAFLIAQYTRQRYAKR